MLPTLLHPQLVLVLVSTWAVLRHARLAASVVAQPDEDLADEDAEQAGRPLTAEHGRLRERRRHVELPRLGGEEQPLGKVLVVAPSLPGLLEPFLALGHARRQLLCCVALRRRRRRRPVRLAGEVGGEGGTVADQREQLPHKAMPVLLARRGAHEEARLRPRPVPLAVHVVHRVGGKLHALLEVGASDGRDRRGVKGGALEVPGGGLEEGFGVLLGPLECALRVEHRERDLVRLEARPEAVLAALALAPVVHAAVVVLEVGSHRERRHFDRVPNDAEVRLPPAEAVAPRVLSLARGRASQQAAHVLGEVDVRDDEPRRAIDHHAHALAEGQEPVDDEALEDLPLRHRGLGGREEDLEHALGQPAVHPAQRHHAPIERAARVQRQRRALHILVTEQRIEGRLDLERKAVAAAAV